MKRQESDAAKDSFPHPQFLQYDQHHRRVASRHGYAGEESEPAEMFRYVPRQPDTPERRHKGNKRFDDQEDLQGVAGGGKAKDSPDRKEDQREGKNVVVKKY